MLLCDIGNTSYHFLDAKDDYKKHVDIFDPKTITHDVYYICVNPQVSKILNTLENWINLADSLDMQHYYATMGVDRIFACEAISNGVIIDAGSAITVDVVENGIFQGGFIYPGSLAMNQTYKNISSALDYNFNYQLDLNKLPKNSADAISYGFLKTLYNEVVSYDKDIYITGGDAEKLLNIFKNANLEKQLIFNGMKKVIKRSL